MKKIKGLKFYSSISMELMSEIAIYEHEFGFMIISVIGAKVSGVLRMSEDAANGYYSDMKHEICKYYNNEQFAYTTVNYDTTN